MLKKYISRQAVLTLFLLLIFSVHGEAAKIKQALLVVHELVAAEPSPGFFSVIHTVVPSFGKTGDILKTHIISNDALASKYAKIILHSYGLTITQVDILDSIQALKLDEVALLYICGKPSSKVQDYLRRKGVEFNLITEEDDTLPKNEFKKIKDFDTVIIVLGTGPLDETTPSLDMVKRVETAIKVLDENPHSLLLFSGGKTAGSISEARMMALIAYARGVFPSEVILEEKSLTTIENAKFSAQIVGSFPIKKCILISRPTHLKRAVPIFSKYPEFKEIQVAPSYISKEEITRNLEEYLAYNESKRVRQILGKILREYRDSEK